MDAGFCGEALNEALAEFGRPEIFNSGQGSQFTSFNAHLHVRAQRCESHDLHGGRGRCMENIFIERLWRLMKYEAVHLHEMTDGFLAERVIGEWIGANSDAIRPGIPI